MRYRIERDCCTSGYCIVCRREAPLGQTVRVLQCTANDKDQAEAIAGNWSRYKAKVIDTEAK